MPQYRLLTLQELQELEKEFIEFLVINSITADDWEKIKAVDKPKAERIIELFSDVVFETILRKVKYLEFRSASEVLCCQCLEGKIVYVGMKNSSNDETIDFTNDAFLASATISPPEGMKIFTTERTFSGKREVEIFHMMEKGYTISDGALFKSLCLFL